MSNEALKIGLVTEALYKKIAKYDKLPAELLYQDFNDEESVAIMLAALSGTPQGERDILGNFTGVQSYALYLRTVPESDGERINAETLLNDIARWLEQEENYPSIDGIDIYEIEQTQSAAIIERTDGQRTYQTIIQVSFELEAEL